jgi:peptide/nickel transport system permease protein
MVRFVGSRVLQAAGVLVLVSLVAFGLLEAAPGDPALRIASERGGEIVSDREVEAIRGELGLDRPIWERYAAWLSDTLRLDLGHSYVNREPVARLLRERFPASFALAAATIAISTALGVPLGVLAAARRGPLDTAVRTLSLVLASMPSFWLSLLAIWLFAAELRWLPAIADFSPRGLVLPVAVLALRTMALLIRVTRATVIEALAMPHVTVARGRGLPERLVVTRHAVRNALVPAITVIGLDFATLLAGAAVVEWVFAYPGVGRLGVQAALNGDVPVVLGFVLLASVALVVVNTVVDILCGLLDPTIRPARTVTA